MDIGFNIFLQMCKVKYVKFISLLLIIIVLSLMFSYKHIMADGDGGTGIKLEDVPPGAEITATLENMGSVPPPKLIVDQGQEVLVFLCESEGQLVLAPAEGIKYGEIFVIEARFLQLQAERSTFDVELNWEGSSAPDLFRLDRVDDTGTVYRSRELRAAFNVRPYVGYAFDPGGG